MKGRILIVGSGRMARNVGLFFAGQGYATSWLSRDGQRLAALESWARRRLRRFSALGTGPEASSFHLARSEDLPTADIVLEAVDEQVATKRAALGALPEPLLSQALLLSTSSSILPSDIHRACAGMHFFYPVELTRLVELVLPPLYPASRRERLLELSRHCGLDVVEQNERSAFAVNQLLLPLQAECLRALIAGASSAELDHATVSPLLPVGQLELMDAIGLDVVLPAARNYLDRMPAELACDLEPLCTGLGELLDLGKRGAKNGDGLRCGAPLPWPPQATPVPGPEMFRGLFLNSCLLAVDRGLIGHGELDRVLGSVFGAVLGCEQALRVEDPLALRRTLEDLFIRTRRWYFSPARPLAEDRA